MALRKTFYLFGIMSILLVAACAKGISKQARSHVTYSGTFTAFQKNPDAYEGEVVLIGGKIIETQVNSAFSEISVLQLPLGRGDRPQMGDRSEGRFLLRSKRLLDPAVYGKGVALTVVGKLIGSKARTIGEFTYEYPVVEPIEIKLWQEGKGGGSSVLFGFGILTTF